MATTVTVTLKGKPNPQHLFSNCAIKPENNGVSVIRYIDYWGEAWEVVAFFPNSSILYAEVR